LSLVEEEGTSFSSATYLKRIECFQNKWWYFVKYVLVPCRIFIDILTWRRYLEICLNDVFETVTSQWKECKHFLCNL